MGPAASALATLVTETADRQIQWHSHINKSSRPHSQQHRRPESPRIHFKQSFKSWRQICSAGCSVKALTGERHSHSSLGLRCAVLRFDFNLIPLRKTKYFSSSEMMFMDTVSDETPLNPSVLFCSAKTLFLKGSRCNAKC